MDFTTLIGIIAGAAFIIIGIELEGDIGNFYNFASILITIGGTIAATLIHYPFTQIARLGRILMKVFTYKKQDVSEGIRIILDFAVAARREGLLTLEARAGDIEDRFLQKGIMLIVDGTNPELVRSLMETELSFIEERHKQGRSILESMATYAPAFGLIGTLIGLINMLKHLNDPSSLGPAMAVALVTTFYGAVLANFILLPMAGRLKSYTAEEVLYKEVILEGILSIQAGENPRIIEEKLNAFIASPRKGKPGGEAREVREANA